MGESSVVKGLSWALSYHSPRANFPSHFTQRFRTEMKKAIFTFIFQNLLQVSSETVIMATQAAFTIYIKYNIYYIKSFQNLFLLLFFPLFWGFLSHTVNRTPCSYDGHKSKESYQTSHVRNRMYWRKKNSYKYTII